MAEGIEVDKETRSGFNPMMVVFVLVSVIAGLYFVTSVAALVFPDLDIPFMWATFPVGPQGPPVGQ
jgi:hypothetical protein